MGVALRECACNETITHTCTSGKFLRGEKFAIVVRTKYKGKTVAAQWLGSGNST